MPKVRGRVSPALGGEFMSFSFQIQNNTVWAAISGEVDMRVAPLWRSALDRELAASLARNLTFDFSEVSFVDSSGLGVVLGRYKKVVSRGGHVKIVGARSIKFWSFPALPS